VFFRIFLFSSKLSVSGYKTLVVEKNCSDPNTVFAKANGITSSSKYGTWVTYSYEYPNEYGTYNSSNFPDTCDEKDHYKSQVSIFSYGKSMGGYCILGVQDDYGTTAHQWCSGIKSGQVALAVTSASYGSSSSNESKFIGYAGFIL